RHSTGRAIWIPAVRQAHHEGVGGRLASLLSESLPSAFLSAPPDTQHAPPTPLMVSLSNHGGVEHPLLNRSTGTALAEQSGSPRFDRLTMRVSTAGLHLFCQNLCLQRSFQHRLRMRSHPRPSWIARASRRLALTL